MQEARVTRLMRDGDPVIQAMTKTKAFQRRVTNMEKARPKIVGVTVTNKKMATMQTTEALHQTVDGRGLASMGQCGGQDVLMNGTTLMTGGMYIQAMRIMGTS